MGKNYAYKFLEKYGFRFSVDPYNTDRPCYLHMNSKFDIMFTLITSCVTILLAVLYFKLKKDRKDKGYIGGLFATKSSK